MIIILALFFSLSAFSMQRYGDRPGNPNPNDPKKNNNTIYNSSEPFYNPSYRGPTFVNAHETWAEEFERLTDTRVIFPGPGNGNSQNIKKQNTPSVYAQIELRSTNNINNFNESIKNYFTADLVFYYQNNHFYWKKNQQQSENFDSLANTITHASQKTFQGYLPINNLTIDKDASYSTPIPSQPFDQIKKNDWFILWITTPNITKNKQIALTIALANSRLRDIKEGAYAILSRFNYRLAQELSRKETQDQEELLKQAVSYLTQQNVLKINEILKEPGDPNYLEKLKNSEIKSNTYMHILPILLHLYALASTGTFLYTVFKNKKMPSFPNNFLKKGIFFISVLANGYLIKNIFNQLYLLKYPNKETDGIY